MKKIKSIIAVMFLSMIAMGAHADLYSKTYFCVWEALESNYDVYTECQMQLWTDTEVEHRAVADAQRDFANRPVWIQDESDYGCAMEALLNEMGPASFCVGNSRDPDQSQLNEFARAEREYRRVMSKGDKFVGCIELSFSIGIDPEIQCSPDNDPINLSRVEQSILHHTIDKLRK